LIDNESTDETVEIAESFRGNGLVQIVTSAYPGYYDWIGLLRVKEALARQIDADWLIHQDADEILEGPEPVRSLRDWIATADSEGYSAINFDEFVFVPTSEDDKYEGTDYVALMRYYYFFEPYPLRLVRGWRKAPDIDLSSTGGHMASFASQKIYPIHFVLRHYIALSMRHLREKYLVKRRYSEVEVRERGWHGWRARFRESMVQIPHREDLFRLEGDETWNRSRPHAKHIIVTDSE
jgi:hypothetical protein